MKIVILIPTYCEVDNIAKLIPEIKLATKNLQHEVTILVVDDTSPDGTGKAVLDLMKQDKKIQLLTGEKKGYGAAIIRGVNYSISKLKAEVIVTMDADFSHQPKDLPRLINEIEKGSDFVIGSRYVKGGKIKNWSPWRYFLSGLGNFVARKVLGLSKVFDCTAGYRVFQTDLVKKIGLSSIKANGYGFLVWFLYSCHRNGAKIKEVPVEFVDRTAGKTKLGLWDIIEGIIILIKLRITT
jgi:dolichol-phosphate mannosyltransferase